jgi:hypothetical protein
MKDKNAIEAAKASEAETTSSKKALTLDKIVGSTSQEFAEGTQKGVYAYPLSCKNCQHCVTPTS